MLPQSLSRFLPHSPAGEFHTEGISFIEDEFHLPQANFIEKEH